LLTKYTKDLKILIIFRKIGIAPIEILHYGAMIPAAVIHPWDLAPQGAIASHMDLMTDMPSVGCEKTRLWGLFIEPDSEKGSFSYLRDLEDRSSAIGAALGTRSGVMPVFVSVGHKTNLNGWNSVA
jgi:hypothetical protein